MSFQAEFEKAYEAKKNEDMDLILTFLDEWEEKADLEHIPYIMKLYVNTALEDEQNDKITETLSTIIHRKPEKSIETIIQNIRILIIEKAEYCIVDIMDMLFFDYDDYACFIAASLLNVDKEVKQILLDIINNNLKSIIFKETAEKVISIYNTLEK